MASSSAAMPRTTASAAREPGRATSLLTALGPALPSSAAPAIRCSAIASSRTRGEGSTWASNGVTFNDLDDPDTGPNDLLNFPVMTIARLISAGCASSARSPAPTRPCGSSSSSARPRTRADLARGRDSSAFITARHHADFQRGPAVVRSGGRPGHHGHGDGSLGNTSEFSQAVAVTSGKRPLRLARGSATVLARSRDRPWPPRNRGTCGRSAPAASPQAATRGSMGSSPRKGTLLSSRELHLAADAEDRRSYRSHPRSSSCSRRCRGWVRGPRGTSSRPCGHR